MKFSSSVDAAHDLLRHVPPKDIEIRLRNVCKLNPSLIEDLFSTIDVPHKVGTDPTNDMKYILCDFNRDCDSYRSPFSNQYYPELKDGLLPSDDLRQMEIISRNAFESYRKLYFLGGVLSTYAWNISNNSFGFGVFVQKDIDDLLHDGTKMNGSISCTDVFEIKKKNKNNYEYKMISSILLHCNVEISNNEIINMSGGVSNQTIIKAEANGTIEHLITIGQMVENNSSVFMEKVKQIYIGKMNEIFTKTKHIQGDKELKKQMKLLAESINEINESEK